MLPIPLLKLGRHFLDKRGGIKELAVLSYPIDNSDGTSNTVSYVNSLAILLMMVSLISRAITGSESAALGILTR